MPEQNSNAAPAAVPPTVPAVVAEPYESGPSEEFFEAAPEPVAAPAAAASPPPPPAPPAKTKHTHPRWVERAAIEMGLGDEEIEGMPTDALQQKIYQSSQRMLREGRANAVADDAGRRGEQSRPEPEPAPVVDQYAGLNLPEEGGWDESFQGWAKNVKETIAAQAAEIEQLKAVAQQVRQGQVQTVAQRFETFFAKHPDVYNDPFRQQAMIDAIAKFDKRTTLENDLNTIHARLFGATPAPNSPPSAPAPQSDPTREAFVEAYREGTVSRPTQRNPVPLPKGRAAAVAAVGNFRREHELNGVQHDDDPADSLP